MHDQQSDRGAPREAGPGSVAFRGLLLAAALVFGGCSSRPIPSVEAYDTIPMRRVEPYPGAASRARRSFRVLLVDLPSEGLDERRLLEPRRSIRRQLRRQIEEAGATVPENEAADADYSLGFRFSTHRDRANWKPPFKLLWEDAEEGVAREGTCTHRADVAYEIEIRDLRDSGHRLAHFFLGHHAERESRTLDESCPLESAARSVLFERVLDESLACLRGELESRFAPRGHVMAHRETAATAQHIFQISLGAQQGMRAGSRVEIRREEHAATPTGEAWRSERVIATGVVSDEIGAQESWVAIDLGKASDEILEGDVVRPVPHKGLLASLSGPDCQRILQQR